MSPPPQGADARRRIHATLGPVCYAEGSHRDELADLISVHHRYHPDGRPSPARGLINRCAARQQQRLDSIMKATWRPLLDRWRGWLASGGEALPRPAKPIPGNHMGPLFGGKEQLYMTGRPVRLSAAPMNS